MFLFDSGRSEDWQPQLITAADGRVLFLPRGRGGAAYEIPSHLDGYDLERRIKWLWHSFPAALLAVVVAAVVTERWWILFLLVVVALLRHVIEAAMLSDLRIAEDSIAVAAAAVSEGGNPLGALLAAAAAVGWYLWDMPNGDGRGSAALVAALIAVAFGALELSRAVHRWRAHAERPLDVSGTSENRPIVPR